MLGRFRWPIALAALAAALTGGLVAGFSTEPLQRASVQQVTAAPPSGSLVVLEGTVRPLGGDRLMLTDTTGEIRLNTCPTWYYPLPFGAHETVRVEGQLAPTNTWRNDHPVFLVYRIQSEQRKRIRLRYTNGAPLWHSYRAVPGQRLQWEIWREKVASNSQQSP